MVGQNKLKFLASFLQTSLRFASKANGTPRSRLSSQAEQNALAYLPAGSVTMKKGFKIDTYCQCHKTYHFTLH
jgi:hypothetical protein